MYKRQAAEIVEKAKAGGVKLDPLSRYYIKNTEKHEQNGQENPYENTYVMNYSSVNMENIDVYKRQGISCEVYSRRKGVL